MPQNTDVAHTHCRLWLSPQYLSSCCQFVVIDGSISSLSALVTSVPQGSILVLVLFLIAFDQWYFQHSSVISLAMLMFVTATLMMSLLTLPPWMHGSQTKSQTKLHKGECHAYVSRKSETTTCIDQARRPADWTNRHYYFIWPFVEAPYSSYVLGKTRHP